VLFIVAASLPQRVPVTLLMLLSPFQTIDTRFGTSSVVLVYVVFIASLLRKQRLQLPMLRLIMFLLLWYFVSMSMMPTSTYIHHGVYMFSFISAFLVFWLCFDLTNHFERPTSIVDVFIVMNVLIAVYCVFQLWLGPGERFVFFGIDELNMTRVRRDGRLTGPFQSAEITAQYFVLMQFLVIHQFWYATKVWYRRSLIVLAAVNLACLVATGSRGEFLVLVGGAFVYLWLFRRRLGVMRAIAFAVGGVVIVTATALIIVSFTEFGSLFDRLAETEINEQGIPDTRQRVWPETWSEVVKSPIIGHGPQLRFYLEDQGMRYEDHVYITYPHSLYLFLLFTVGVPGLTLFMSFLLTIGWRCWRAMSNEDAAPYFSDLARTGVIVIFLFLVDGLKIDQVRLGLVDYWHFFFGLCGVFLAACRRVAAAEQATEVAEANPQPLHALPALRMRHDRLDEGRVR
jgi:O-antigen ligase